MPTSNPASHDNHDKINSWVSFSFLYGYGAGYGAALGGPLGRRISAMSGDQMPSLLGRKRRKIPGYARGDVEASIWLVHLSQQA